MKSRSKPFTGKHMAAIMVGGFGIVVAVNLAMASMASATFGGIVVENSYVASQQFNDWLDQAEASERLGWKVEPFRLADGRIALRMTGVPTGAKISAIARHPVGREGDRVLSFTAGSDGAYASTGPLSAGRWILRMSVEADGSVWRGEAQVR